MQRTHSNRERLDTLGAISRALSSTLDLRALCDTLYHEIERVMDTTFFSIALLEPGRRFLSVPYTRFAGTLVEDRRIPSTGNLTSLVIRLDTPLLFRTRRELEHHTRQHDLPPDTIGGDESQAVLIVPLNTGRRTIGVLSVESRHPAAYDAQELEMLLVIASQAAVSIENARLYEQSREAHRQMQALLQAARALNSSLDPTSALEAILVSMRDVMPYAYAAVLLPDHAAGVLDMVGSIGPLGATSLAEDRSKTFKIPFGQGVSGTVFTTGRALVVPDVREFAGFVDHDLEGILSEIAVPLKRGDTVVGVVDAGREGVDSFSPDDLDLLSLFASQATIAIENAQLFSEQRRRVGELQVLQGIMQTIGSLHDVSAITKRVRQELKRLIDYYECRVYILDEAGTTLLSIDDPIPGTTPRLALGEGFAGWVAQQGRSDLIPNTLKDSRVVFFVDSLRSQAASMIGAPLIYEGRVRGAITLSKLGIRQLDENSLRLLEIIAAQIVLAFDRAHLYRQLRLQATTDPLVKLWNRRYLLDRYKEERARALRNGRPLACLILDIDKFKHVNDTYGHDAGDAVLRSLSTIIRSQIRTEDIAARYGGEEFCVLLPECSIANAATLGERLRRSIAAHRLPAAAGVTRVTVSIGLAALSPDDSGTEVLTRADQAMYRAKGAGGNCLWIARDGEFLAA